MTQNSAVVHLVHLKNVPFSFSVSKAHLGDADFQPAFELQLFVSTGPVSKKEEICATAVQE